MNFDIIEDNKRQILKNWLIYMILCGPIIANLFFLPRLTVVGITLFFIFLNLLTVLFNNLFPKILKIKTLWFAVSSTTILHFIAPLILGFLLMFSILLIPNPNVQKINNLWAYAIFTISSLSICTYMVVHMKKIIPKESKLLKLSTYTMAALFGTAYAVFDILGITDISDSVKPIFLGVFITVLFSRVIIEWGNNS